MVFQSHLAHAKYLSVLDIYLSILESMCYTFLLAGQSRHVTIMVQSCVERWSLAEEEEEEEYAWKFNKIMYNGCGKLWQNMARNI